MKIETAVNPVDLPNQSPASCVAPSPIAAANGTTDVPRYDEDPVSQSEDQKTVWIVHSLPFMCLPLLYSTSSYVGCYIWRSITFPRRVL